MSKKSDSLGDRMKGQYENRTKSFLPRRTYTLIRIDGKSFSQYTKNCNKPFDSNFMRLMDETAKYLCENIQGCRFSFQQSDEITLLLTDFENVLSDAFFNGNIQKIVSITAAMATAKFNQLVWKDYTEECYVRAIEERKCEDIPKLAMFDSRTWTIPDPIEVENSVIWRQQDATRNSISMAAQAVCSHKSLQGANQAQQQQEMMFQAAGINWNDYSDREKRGGICIKNENDGWQISQTTPIFTTPEGRAFLKAMIPKHE